MRKKMPPIGIEWALIKLAMLLLRYDKIEPAKKILRALTQRYPYSFRAYRGLANVAERVGDKEAELSVWRSFAENVPNHPIGQLKLGELLRLTTLFDEAEAHFQVLLLKNPSSQKVLAALARTASSARNYHLAAQRWQQLTDAYPKDFAYARNLIRALLEILEFDRAQAIYEKHRPKRPNLSYQMLQIDICLAKSDVEKASEIIGQLHDEHPNNRKVVNRKIRLLTKKFQTTGNIEHANEVISVLDTFELKNSSDTDLLEFRIEINIMLGREDAAQALLSTLEPDRSKKNMVMRAWGLSHQGNIDGAKSLWRDITRLYFPTRVLTPSPGCLQQTDTHSTQLPKDAIVLFTVIRNERWRLQWFLEYYRSLGVERFFFVDNDSTDGTAEFLHQQEDVHVFWTKQSYAKAYSGMQWVNWLVDQYGDECWCIYADVDEALVFPSAEKRGLRNLTDYMTEHGHEAMQAFMLDMYAPHLKSIPRENEYTDFLTDYPLFENEYSWVSTAYCPYRFTAGGIRRTFKLSENQTKTPLIRGGIGIKFLMSSHFITPAHLCDVTGVFLHFKLAGDFEETFVNDLTDNSRIARCQMRHWKYIEALKDLPEGESFVSEQTVSFQSSQQLVDLGILNTSASFEAGHYD